MMKHRTILALGLAASLVPAAAIAQDMPLSQVLLDGESWKLVSDGHGFTDACTADDQGNFYFSDVKGGPGIYKVDLQGEVTLWIDHLPGVSGMQFGPDGRLYACQGREQRLISVAPGEEPKILVEGVRPNDLVVTADAGVYFTHTGPKTIDYVSPDGQHRVVHQGDLIRPNGITLSPNQGTLIVSDHGGKHTWAFRIEADGGLSHSQPYMTLRTPMADPEISRGDGATTDAYGRYYITSAAGVQMFDPTGRLGGVIAIPQVSVVSIEFAGRSSRISTSQLATRFSAARQDRRVCSSSAVRQRRRISILSPPGLRLPFPHSIKHHDKPDEAELANSRLMAGGGDRLVRRRLTVPSRRWSWRRQLPSLREQGAGSIPRSALRRGQPVRTVPIGRNRCGLIRSIEHPPQRT